MLGSLYLPEIGKNSQPQQGRVLVAGPDSGVEKGTHVMFHPWRGQKHFIGGRDTLLLERRDLTAWVNYLGENLFDLLPLRDQVMIRPDWSSKYRQPSKLIHLPDTALEQGQPVLQGTVLDLGEDVRWIKDRGFNIGDSVFIEPHKGSEIGWGYDLEVYYFLSPNHIIARIDNAPDSGNPAQPDPS